MMTDKLSPKMCKLPLLHLWSTEGGTKPKGSSESLHLEKRESLTP